MIETSVIIPTKNGAQDIGVCLEAVFSQKGAGRVEVLVIDSGSTDSTLEIVRRYPVRLERIPPETFHHARTRNHGASLAEGKFLVFLSQDAIPSSNAWLAAMLANFTDETVGAVYGKQLPKSGRNIERQYTLNVHYGDLKIVKDVKSREKLGYRYYFFSDANSAIRKNVWQVTGFPEELKIFEDIGIAKRILESGKKIVYEPRACVYHSHDHTTTELFRRYFDYGVTLRRLGIWNREMRRSMMVEISAMVWKKLTEYEKGHKGKFGASVHQDVAKTAGLLLGVSEWCLPKNLKRRFSGYGVFDLW